MSHLLKVLKLHSHAITYSQRMMAEGYVSETDFLQGVLHTALLRYIPEESWPPMTEEEKARLKEHLNRDDVDSDIPF